MPEDTIYGPFFDEEFFIFHDKTTLRLEQLEVYEANVGFIGFDRLGEIYALGREGSYDDIMFSGRITLKKTSYLCLGGLKKLLGQVQKDDPTMDPYKLEQACKMDEIIVEVQCQLAGMPVCYLTNTPANSIVIYSKNQNHVNNQRRYIVETFHIACFRRSELTLHRYYVLKFVMDACKAKGEVPRKDRDVHWLVQVYMEDYSTVFKKHDRPRLHRNEVYDHFATHAEWLRNVFSHKLLVDRGKWAEWVDDAKRMRKMAKRADSKWGSAMTARLPPLRRRPRSISVESNSENNMDIDYRVRDIEYRDVIVNLPSSDSDTSAKDPSSSESESDADVPYAHDPRLRSRVHEGLLLPMPGPTWHWNCEIKEKCPFVIHIGNDRRRDAPCLEPLSEREKDYIMDKKWKLLFDKKLIRIWKKMCQAHMDWHWREVGLVLDHKRHLVYDVEEEERRANEED